MVKKDINNKFLSEFRKSVNISILNESMNSYVTNTINDLKIVINNKRYTGPAGIGKKY